MVKKLNDFFIRYDVSSGELKLFEPYLIKQIYLNKIESNPEETGRNFL